MERLTNRKTKLAKGGPEPSMLDVVHKLAEYEDLEDRLKEQFNGCVDLKMIIYSIIVYDSS